MSDAFKVFFAGIEEFARSMKEQSSLGLDRGVGQKELGERIESLIERVERMVTILEEKLGTMVDIAPVKGKRMMDIKQRIVEEVGKHPEGIRPPQMARTLSTKVQNLYPHLKQNVQQKLLVKDDSGAYFPAGATRQRPSRKS